MKDFINVYWAPYIAPDEPDWNMLYRDPDLMLKEFKDKINPGLRNDSFLYCPSVLNKFKKTYLLRNGQDSKFNFTEDQEITPLTKDDSYVKMKAIRRPTISGTNDFIYSHQWIFFSDEPLIADFTAPYFHKPKYLNYAAIVPGSMDIGQWFRPYNAEIITWEKDGYIEFKKDEPLAYVHFNTDKEIVLKRFNMNEKLIKYSSACTSAPRFYGSGLPLAERYKRFNQSKMNKMILKEIQDCLVD